MRIEIPVIPPGERTPLVEALLAIIDAQQQRLRQLEETVQQLRDEIAVLKGQKPRPKIAPSRLETPPKQPAGEGAKRPVPRSVPRRQSSWNWKNCICSCRTRRPTPKTMALR